MRFEAFGVRVQSGIRTSDRGDRSFVELSQTARRDGQERQQRFFAAFEKLSAIEAKLKEIWPGTPKREEQGPQFAASFEKLSAIESKAREVWRGEEWERRKSGDAEERNRVVQLSGFTMHGINVRMAVRPDGSTILRLSQTSTRPDGSERTQSFDIRLDRFSEIIGRSRELQPKEWFVLASLHQKLDTGAVVTIQRAYTSRTEAELAAHKSSLFVIPQVFATRPEPGQQRVMSQGESPKLDRQMREARWKEATDGEYHAVGRWFDKESEPYLDQRVRSTTFAEYRGEHFEHRVTPRNGPLDQGSRDEPLFVVYRKPERADAPPRIAAICKDEGEATARMRDLDDGVRAQRVATNNRTWETVDFSAGLREFAPARFVRSITVGETTGTIWRRIDEHGKQQRTVELTRPERQADGSVKEVTTTLPWGEFRALAKGLGAVRQEPREVRAAQAEERKPAVTQEQPRAPEHADNKHFVLTVWQAKELPRKGVTWVKFPLGEAVLENRPSFPAHGQWTPREASDPITYLLVKRTLGRQGVGVAEGFVVGADKRELALQRTEVREGQAVAKERNEQRLEANRQERQHARALQQGF